MKLSIKAKLIFAIIGILSYSYFLLANIPAVKIWQLAPLPAWIQGSSPIGTLWQGKISRLSVNGEILSNIDWNIAKWRLLIGQIVIDINLADETSDTLWGQVRIIFSLFSDPSIMDLNLSVPAAKVLNYIPASLPANLAASGQLALSLPTATAGKPWCRQVSGKLVWQQGVLTTALGDIKFNEPVALFSCEQGSLVTKVTANSPQVAITLKLKLINDNKYQIDGWLKPSSELLPAITDSLKMLPFLERTDIQGRYNISFNGLLPLQ